MRAAATPADGGWLARGEKAWVTHGGQADFYSTFLRTPADGERGISCFHLTPDLDGFSAARPEEKMGMTGSTTAAIRLDDVPIPADRLAAAWPRWTPLGVSAVATGLAQSALERGDRLRPRPGGVRPADRRAPGRSAFLLADMAAAVESARATSLIGPARRKDARRAVLPPGQHRQAGGPRTPR